MPSWVDDGAADPAADHLVDGETASTGDGVQEGRPDGARGEIMPEPGCGPFGVWWPAGSALALWRPGLVSVVVAVGAVVLLFAAACAAGRSDDAAGGVDWADPDSVASVFIERYAVHDPAACELVTSVLRGQLERDGRCAGPVRGSTPRLMVLESLTCGGVHDFAAVVTPEGEVGRRFVLVGLERAGGTAWLVRSVLPIGDCRVLVSRTCGGGR